MTKLRELLIVTLTIASVACTHSKSRSNKSGGQDGGGGHVFLSTAPEVHLAISRALDLTSAVDSRINLMSAFLTSQLASTRQEDARVDIDENATNFDRSGNPLPPPLVPADSPPTNNDIPSQRLQQHLVKVVTGYEPKCIMRDFDEVIKDPDCPAELRLINPKISRMNIRYHLHEVLTITPIRIQEQGQCRDAGDDASVNGFKPGAEICFSIQNLRRIPSADLLREISALLIHELAHIHGFGESDAQEIQQAFLGFYNFRFSNLSQERTASETKKLIMAAMNNLMPYRALDAKDYQDLSFNPPDDLSRVRIDLLKTLNDLEALPFALDPLALKIQYWPENIDSAIAYSVSVAFTLVELRKYLGSAPAMDRKSDLALSVSGEQVHNLRAIAFNWNSLTGSEKGNACLNPPTRDFNDNFDFSGVFDSPNEIEQVRNLIGDDGTFPACPNYETLF